MAMSDDMDDLLLLYRNASREAPSPMMDARVLRAADNVASHRRWHRRIAWPAAIAAAVLLWAMTQGEARHPLQTSVSTAGLDAGTSRVELLRMDVTPPRSDVDRFLLNVTSENHQSTTRNAP
jgi:hypothetical protein